VRVFGWEDGWTDDSEQETQPVVASLWSPPSRPRSQINVRAAGVERSAPSLNLTLTLNLTGANRCGAEERTGHQNDKMTPRRCLGQKASSAVPPFRTRLRCAACSTVPQVAWSARVYSAPGYEFYLRGIPALQPLRLLYGFEVSSFMVSLSLNTAGNPTSAESGGILFPNSYLRTSRGVYHFHYWC
jgi:hypothetical protein